MWERLLTSNPNYPDRAKLQQQIAALSEPAAAAPISAAPAKPGTAGVEDLLQRMKTRQQ